ncbi:MAG TPA: hypothetical protein VE978_16620, partial [Chitinophagales bacterium]|nr:hypothetical protein [Chitinophagales bacterium]
MKNLHKHALIFFFFFLISYSFESFGYTVTQLAGLYQNGQVFLTWQNPTGSNFQYNVYRSATPLTTSSQLTSSTFLGYVRDSSA